MLLTYQPTNLFQGNALSGQLPSILACLSPTTPIGIVLLYGGWIGPAYDGELAAFSEL